MPQFKQQQRAWHSNVHEVRYCRWASTTQAERLIREYSIRAWSLLIFDEMLVMLEVIEMLQGSSRPVVVSAWNRMAAEPNTLCSILLLLGAAIW
jgi:hypothetical protein